MEYNRINMLGINLTYRCNLKCFMCGQRNNKSIELKQELDFDHLCRFILEAKKYGLRYGVYLWGGEPFLYSHMRELLEFLHENKIFVTINTNGTMLEHYAEDIIRNKVYNLIISIDGIGEVHDKIRGVSGTFSRVKRGIEKINELKKGFPAITTNTVVTSENYDKLFDILSGIDELGVNNMECQLPIHFSPACGSLYEKRMKEEFQVEGSHWKGFVGDYSNFDVEVMNEQINQIKDKFGRKFKLSPNLNYEQLKLYFTKPEAIYPDRVCSLPFSQIHVEPNGDAVVCPDFPDFKFGNIYASSVEELWNSQKLEKFRASLKEKQLSICSRCCQFYIF